MRTRVPSSIAVRCSSSTFVPYSSAYSALIVSGGSLPGRRAGTKPHPSSKASAAPSRKPRASPPTTTWGRRSLPHSVIRVTTSCRAAASASSGMMSLKPIPLLGKSGTSRTRAFRSVGTELGAGDVAQVAPEQELGELLGEAGERVEVVHRGLAPLGVAGTERWRNQLLDERR